MLTVMVSIYKKRDKGETYEYMREKKKKVCVRLFEVT